MLQTLSNQRFPPTHIAQLSGHNINSIENYRSLSKQQQQQQQQSMSNMLANISCEKAVSLPKATANNPLPLKMRTLAQPRESSGVTEQQSVGIFLVKQLSRADSSQLQLTPKNSTTRKPAVERTACTKSRSNETQAHVLRIAKTMVLAYAKGLRLTQSTTPQSTPLRSRQNFPTGSKSSLMNQYLKQEQVNSSISYPLTVYVFELKP